MIDSLKTIRGFKFLYAVAIMVFCCTTSSYGKSEVPVFLLSGQSNMSGYFGSVNDLTADQKKSVDSVKIFMNGDGDNGKKNKWLTLGPGFGAFSSFLGPELSFGRTLSDSMPDIRIALVKLAVGGTYLAKAEEWLPPSSNNGKGGNLYRQMMSTIDAAMKSFSSAFDTSKYTPRWAGFVWFQGEFDAYDRGYANAYEKNLTNLINDIRAEVKVTDLPVILPMIDVQNQWTHNGIVRNADIAVSKKMENVDTLDTKGLPTDGTHYKAAGYITIGQVCAQRWLAMRYTYGEKVHIVNSYSNQYVIQNSQIPPYTIHTLFDLSGKMISSHCGVLPQRKLTKNISNKCIVIHSKCLNDCHNGSQMNRRTVIVNQK
jgi:hypothetical protein